MISIFVAVLRNNSHCNRSFFCKDAEIFSVSIESLCTFGYGVHSHIVVRLTCTI